MPETLRLVVLPAVSLIIMVPATMLVIGPLGVYAGEGIAFVLAASESIASAPTALGVLGGDSFGIRFDTNQNEAGDPNSDFSQFVLNGNIGATSTSFDPYHLHADLEDGRYHDVTIRWNAASQT